MNAQPQDDVLLSKSFVAFVLLVVFNFVLIFSGQPELRALAGVFTLSLALAAGWAMATMAHARMIGLIVMLLALTMALLLSQQMGFAV